MKRNPNKQYRHTVDGLLALEARQWNWADVRLVDNWRTRDGLTVVVYDMIYHDHSQKQRRMATSYRGKLLTSIILHIE